MEIRQSFLKGINRSISRKEFFDPDFFYSLQNARILQTGNIGEVVRIKGYNKINTSLDDLETLFDLVRVDNDFVVFYENDSHFVIKVFDKNGVVLNTFTYQSTPTVTGELKQHDDTVLIAPHNKVLYKKEDEYFLKDFISNIPIITNIDVDDLSDKALYNLTVNQTLSGGFEGARARGELRFISYNIPTNLEDSFRIVIGNDTSSYITIRNIGLTDLLNLIAERINTESVFNGKWTASVAGNSVFITRQQIGNQYNNIDIKIIDSNFINTEVTPDTGGGSGSGGSGGGGTGDGVTPPIMQSLPVPYPTQCVFISTRGGQNSNSIYGSARITIKDAVITQPIEINNSDSTTQIAIKFENILKGSAKVIDQYVINRSSNVISIEAIEGGKEHNTNVSITVNQDTGELIDIPLNFFNLTQVREGRDSSTTGTIKPNTKYWYKARYRFVDGHLTQTCAPVLVDSGAVHPIEVTFNIDIEDLDNTLPKLQIFRKEDGGEFFLIEEMNLDNESIINGIYVYVDDGLSNIEPLNEEVNIWTKSHKTQEVIDNRFVKGNVEYFSEEIDIDSNKFSLSLAQADEQDRDVAPYNSKATIYSRPQYIDGTQGVFDKIGVLDINNSYRKIRIQQTSLVSNPEKDISSLKFYARYLPFGEKQNLRFTSPEMITKNLGSIEDPLLFSNITKVFFGYKYVVTTNSGRIFTRIDSWSEGQMDVKVIGTLNTNHAYIQNGRLFLNIHGEIFSYIPVAKLNSENQTAWMLESFEALKEAVSTGSLELQLRQPKEDGISSVVDDDTLIKQKVKVTGIQDTTEGSRNFNVDKFEGRKLLKDSDNILGIDDKILLTPSDNRIYLTLEESKLDEIDNPQVNKYHYKTKVDKVTKIPRLDIAEVGTIGFELLNFEQTNPAVFDVNNTAQQYGDVGEFQIITGIEHAKFSLINRTLTFEDNAIYLGSKPNQIDGTPVQLKTTGFNYRLRSHLFYSSLTSYNIYETLITQSDFNFDRTHFKNQIVWSSPLLTANYFSGGRNFSVANFYNLPSENGEIIEIVSLGGNLFAFCERGIARLLVGETLTQQKSGNVFIDSSSFITKHIWIQENKNKIEKNSIVKIDNAIYYTTGEDVYRISEGIENISLGILNLDSTKSYKGTYIPSMNEYRLSDGTNTFIFNTKYQQWYGPVTYEPEKTVEIDDKIISVIGSELVQENVGNTFNGVPYTTIIQSVGNDTEVGFFMKLYRKFYLNGTNVNGSVLKYGKDYTEMESVTLENQYIKNGDYNIGIKNTEGNTQKIFWDLETTNDNFRLSGFTTLFHIRRRR